MLQYTVAGFREISKTVADNWKAIDPTTKEYIATIAALLKERWAQTPAHLKKAPRKCGRPRKNPLSATQAATKGKRAPANNDIETNSDIEEEEMTAIITAALRGTVGKSLRRTSADDDNDEEEEMVAIEEPTLPPLPPLPSPAIAALKALHHGEDDMDAYRDEGSPLKNDTNADIANLHREIADSMVLLSKKSNSQASPDPKNIDNNDTSPVNHECALPNETFDDKSISPKKQSFAAALAVAAKNVRNMGEMLPQNDNRSSSNNGNDENNDDGEDETAANALQQPLQPRQLQQTTTTTISDEGSSMSEKDNGHKNNNVTLQVPGVAASLPDRPTPRNKNPSSPSAAAFEAGLPTTINLPANQRDPSDALDAEQDGPLEPAPSAREKELEARVKELETQLQMERLQARIRELENNLERSQGTQNKLSE